MRRVLLVAMVAAAGFSPFKAEEPNVREGNERVASGQPEAALPRYDAAEKAAGPRPEIDYDRGVAYYRMGKSTEARDAFKKSLERGAGELGSRASQNLGSALAAAGDRDGAIAAFRDALLADPRNEDARFNLEVLLRRKQQDEEKKRQEQDQQQQQQQKPQPGGKGSPQGSKGQSPQAQQGAQPGQAPQPEQRPQGDPQQAQQQTGGSDPRTARPSERNEGPRREGEAEALSRDDAARILDAFRAGEKAMPLGRTDKRGGRRADADRDW